jgi:hypothetical protein
MGVILSPAHLAVIKANPGMPMTQVQAIVKGRSTAVTKQGDAASAAPSSGQLPVNPTSIAGSPVSPYSSPGQPLTQPMFPESGFRDQSSMDYLSQVLGLGGMNAGTGQSPLADFGKQDFGSMFSNIMSQLGGNTSFGGNTGIMGGSQPASSYATGAASQPGPAPNPFGVLNQFSGPLGNGGGALSGRKTTQPITMPGRGFY